MPNRLFTSRLKKISYKDEPVEFYPKLVSGFLKIKFDSVWKRISPYVIGKDLLDVGTGVGGIAADLSRLGFRITSIDVDNSSLYIEFPTQIYDGVNFPFTDNYFDTAIVIHVLHHCSDRIRVLKEAMRVSKRVIFIEDTYRNNFEKFVVSVNDMIGNGEYYFHPYSTQNEWASIVEDFGWKVIHKEEYSEFIYKILYGRYTLFVIEKN
jgi:SAM-dependent methyltransferase